jgi:hypothetical protein
MTLVETLEAELDHEKDVLTDDKLPLPDLVEEILKDGVWKVRFCILNAFSVKF